MRGTHVTEEVVQHGHDVMDITSIEEIMVAVPGATWDCDSSKKLHEQTGIEHMMDVRTRQAGMVWLHLTINQLPR